MQTNIQAGTAITALLNELLVGLEGVGVSALSMFADGPRGEPQHWLVYLGIDGHRHFLDTKLYRDLSLEQQAAMLLGKLRQFIRDRG